jgi:hypothetical protein
VPEDLAGLDNPEASALEGTAEGAPDIEKIRQEAMAAATAAAEERFKGFQRVIAEKDTALQRLQREYEEAKLSVLSEEEREAELARRSDQELDRLRAENELLKLMPDYPDELPVFQRLLAAPDAKTQLELLRELRKPLTTANTPAGGSNEPPAVDSNNPASGNPGSGVSIEGAQMTEEMAERLLRSSSRLR